MFYKFYFLLLPEFLSVRLSPRLLHYFLLPSGRLQYLLLLRCCVSPWLVGPPAFPWTVVGSWLPLSILVFLVFAGGGASVSLIWPLVIVRCFSRVRCFSALWFVLSRLLSPPLYFSRQSTLETLSTECKIVLLTPITSPLTWFIMIISIHNIMFIVIISLWTIFYMFWFITCLLYTSRCV